jgi:TonB-linked SusC/RagA family outer membrane protein
MNHKYLKQFCHNKRKKLIGLFFSLLFSVSGFSQITTKVTGTITDTHGSPLIGVTVFLKSTTIGTTSDLDGVYSLEIQDGDNILVFGYVGYMTQEIVLRGQRVINVVLQEETSELDEVVVVGYGTQKKVSVIGAISNISTTEIAKIATPSLSNTLGGQVPGIITRQATGEPGYDQAAVYIRGFGTWVNRAPLVLIDGIERDMNTINTEEIESISVLKDASATAVYGVRGANGVILITTKKGQLGRPKITLRSEMAILQGLRYPNYINSAEYTALVNEGRDNVGLSPAFTEEDIEKYNTGVDPYLYPNVNWVDEILRKTTNQAITNLNIAGGTEVVRFFMNVGYTSQSGLYNEDNLNKYNTNSRVNRYNYRSRLDINLYRDLSLELGVGGIIQERNFPGKSQYDVWNALRMTPPNAFPMINPDGSLSGITSFLGSNPWGMVTQSGYESQNWNTLQGTFGLKWDLSSLVTEGLSLNGRFAYDHLYHNNKQRFKDFEVKQYLGRDSEDNDLYNLLRIENIRPIELVEAANKAIYYEASLNYNRVFARNHNISAMFLFNRREYVNLRNTNITGSLPYRSQGIAGRASYNFGNKYFTEFNFGYNGSEQFPPGKRYGFFPSLSLGWLITNEDFWDHNYLISNLKLRGSYGNVGNDVSGARRFLYLTTMNLQGRSNPFGLDQSTWITGIQDGTIGTPNVTWETARKLNVGLDLGLFNNVVILQIDAFSDKRDGILIERQSVPSITGYFGQQIPMGNLGKAENKGIESMLEVKNSLPSGFFYSFRGNFSFARNKIVENDEPEKLWAYQDKRGKPIDQPFGLVALGFFKNQEDINESPRQTFQSEVRPGDIKYKDVNLDGVIDVYDEVAIGYPRTPEIMYGFGGTVAYKGFDVSIFFNGAARTSFFLEGNTIWPFVDGEGSHNILREYYDSRWTSSTSQIASYPLITNGKSENNYRRSTLWMKDGSYLRLKTAEIGYTFRGKYVDQIFMDNIRLFVNGQNLLTFDKIKIIDPESNDGTGNYPISRIFNVGFQINFK